MMHYKQSKYKLKKFLSRLGIEAAKETPIEELMRALEVATYSGGQPDNLILGSESLEGVLKAISKK